MVNRQSQPNSPAQNAIVQSFLAGEARSSDWTIADSAKLYNVEGWGEPYFGINHRGNLTVCVSSQSKNSIDLAELVTSLKQEGLNLPLLIRFSDILGDRMKRLHHCMAQAIARYGYEGKYQGVFPVKCNQNRQAIEAIVEYGRAYRFGLEVGSKPELAIALASLDSNIDPAPLLMCNGYKDREYIETALLATKLGQKPIIVIEQLQELDLVLAVSRELEIEPVLGVRAKLGTRGIGRWGDSTGDRAKFGLTIAEILQVLRRLESDRQLDYLQLLHFHIGSQISAIRAIKNAIREASQIYVQLAKLGAKMQYLNVGGGLAVDYDGSKTNFPASKNYNMQNYANDIVAQVKDACEQGDVREPTLISESGRAIAAHQSVLIFDVLGTNKVSRPHLSPPKKGSPLVIRNFWQTYQALEPTNLQESYHDAIQFKQEALSLFNFGYLTLAQRAEAEELYWACCCKIADICDRCGYIPDELENFAETMASIYYVNLSIFQSVPDAWAIEQLFPVMPIHRLNEQPIVKATLADITCDSDGKIDRFINPKKPKKLLELHPFSDRQPYYLGMFLVGAYQEIMGNFHNLFGRTDTVQIQIDERGNPTKSIIRGDTISEVLQYVQYDSEKLSQKMRDRIAKALANQTISSDEAQKLLQNYTMTLNNSTYLK
ncbi:MAG: biosynthetic arginine decarboxylase [Cyanobacteria bacterium P01_G01_bin.19]